MGITPNAYANVSQPEQKVRSDENVLFSAAREGNFSIGKTPYVTSDFFDMAEGRAVHSNVLATNTIIPSQTVDNDDLGLFRYETQSDELIVLTGDIITAEDVFGAEPGNIHAVLELSGEYTDNVYNVRDNTESNFIAKISPRFWLVTPKAERIPVLISSYNTSVGGIRYSLPATGSFDRFQAFILGGLDHKMYSINSDLDYTTWMAEGLIQYNLPAGISFRIQDKFIKNRDRFDIGSFYSAAYNGDNDELTLSQELNYRKFISNQAVGYVNVDLQERFSVLLSYVNFYLNYGDAENDWLDRSDRIWAVDLSYHYSPKTSFFIESKYSTSQYKTVDYNDSKDLFFYGGVKWHKSIKTQLMIKGGYQVRSYEDSNGTNKLNKEVDFILRNEDVETFVIETWFNYRFSDKTKMSFQLSKSLEASDTVLSTAKNTIASRFYVDHAFSERWRSHFFASFEHYDYQDYSVSGEGRADEYIGLTPGIKYDFRKWLQFDVAYTFEKRVSNTDLYDFTANTFFIKLTAAF